MYKSVSLIQIKIHVLIKVYESQLKLFFEFYLKINFFFLNFSFHNQSVFVGLRSWTENNAFTHWDSSPIYTFKWDYTNGQPDGIAFLQFCVTLYPDPPHLWHNTRCDSLFQSLCYCHLSKRNYS